ncbi:hypothetical protein [Brevibacillus fulvus]|uniref:Uncharacterized protein n=1 Tax=Brevibacillus fulvus TaxID=1125967 RepID=A0A938XXP7_9BACL|nr:hypothetical protein [Brevibacillus fulvus]MBM7589781.1 hypothetical protein [Brevibacillus fulvus]
MLKLIPPKMQGLEVSEVVMFHPTIFDNIKVVLEGAIYDQDFAGTIEIINRMDLLDLANYSRRFAVEFQLAAPGRSVHPVTATIRLDTTLADIAGEQLQQQSAEKIGCTICIDFCLRIVDMEREPALVVLGLQEIWGNRPLIVPTVSFRADEPYAKQTRTDYELKATLDFQRKIDEGNIEDIHELLEHCIQSLVHLDRYR